MALGESQRAAKFMVLFQKQVCVMLQVRTPGGQVAGWHLIPEVEEAATPAPSVPAPHPHPQGPGEEPRPHRQGSRLLLPLQAQPNLLKKNEGESYHLHTMKGLKIFKEL